MSTLEAVRSVVVNLMIIAALVALPLLLLGAWISGRRRQLVISELVNSAGDPEIDKATRGLTQLARQRIDAELRIVARRRETLHRALGARSSAVESPGRLQHRLDDSLGQLLAAARDVAPEQAKAAMQLLNTIVVRPRGLAVSGILQRRGPSARPRLGVSMDVLSLDGHRSLASQTFWSPAGDPTADAPVTFHEHVIALLGPASRWVAIQLVIAAVFPRGTRGRERGLDRLLSGVLHTQSVTAFPDHSAVFRRRALEELRQAGGALHGAPNHVAALADTLDQLAALSPEPSDARREIYREAHRQYARAVAAMPAAGPLARRYRLREATSWLASGDPQARRNAVERLAADGLRLEQLGSPEELYDAACCHALAVEADAGGGHRDVAVHALVRALAQDSRSGERALWRHAIEDPQLGALPVADIQEALDAELSQNGHPHRLDDAVAAAMRRLA